MQKIEFMNLKAEYAAYKEEFDAAIREVCANATFIMGPQVKVLEAKLAEYVGTKAAITCGSGTDALMIALMALGIGRGDEVITTPFTFIATAEVISLLGATPVFVDIDEESYNIDPKLIESRITPKTKAIIPVSLYGQPADMDEINSIAEKHGIAVIEDACQSFGAVYKGRKSCNLSKIGCTSFFPSKPLGCYGDGGAIFTNDEELAAKIASLRVHGQTARYFHQYVGVNGRLDSVQAAVLNVKMKYLDEALEKRISAAKYYCDNLAGISGIVLPKVRSDRNSVVAQFSIRVKEREKFIEHLKNAGVPTAIHYPKPLHLQAAYENLGYKLGDFPVSERVSKEIVSLPISAFITKEEQDYIIENIKKFF